MAAEAPREKKGFALLVAVIIIAVIAVTATVVAVTLSGDNDQDRIERAADALHRLVAAMDTTKTTTSFGAQVAKWPGQLSQLTHKITSGVDADCTGVAYGGGASSGWRGPYYLVPIPTTGYRIGPGFFVNNLLVRVGARDLALQMDGVSLRDAEGLELIVEKTSTGAGPVVTFALTDPTSVRYHLLSPASNVC